MASQDTARWARDRPRSATMKPVASKAAAAAVTAREREVWSLVEAHLTNSQIADTLCLSVRTVESHVSSLMRKLGVADRRTLARAAELLQGMCSE